MGLYTRKQYEEDCAIIDKGIARSAKLLAEQVIGPLTHWQYAKAADEQKRKLGQRLAMTALNIADKKRTAKSKWFAWVIGAQKEHEKHCARIVKKAFYCNCDGLWRQVRKKAPMLKHQELTNGRWRDTDIPEIEALERSGVTVVESGWGQKNKMQRTVTVEEGAELLQWEEVTEARAIACQQEGKEVEREGKKLWLASWMVRREGDPERGEAVKYFVAYVGD